MYATQGYNTRMYFNWTERQIRKHDLDPFLGPLMEIEKHEKALASADDESVWKMEEFWGVGVLCFMFHGLYDGCGSSDFVTG